MTVGRAISPECSTDERREWQKGAAALAISSRRPTGWVGSRMIRSMYASGSSPVAAVYFASCLLESVASKASRRAGAGVTMNAFEPSNPSAQRLDQAKFHVAGWSMVGRPSGRGSHPASKRIIFLVQNLKRVGRDFTPPVPETFAMVRWSTSMLMVAVDVAIGHRGPRDVAGSMVGRPSGRGSHPASIDGARCRPPWRRYWVAPEGPDCSVPEIGDQVAVTDVHIQNDGSGTVNPCYRSRLVWLPMDSYGFVTALTANVCAIRATSSGG
jgi:hypothetical protein